MGAGQPHGTGFKAQITVEGANRVIGTFASEEEAAKAYDVAAKAQWGVFARTNFDQRDPFPPTAHVVLNNNKSGALLAWEYFHPEKDVPLLIKMIDDRDRWQFKIDGSRELHAGLGAGYPMSFEDWILLVPSGSSDWGKNLGNLVACGATVLRAYDEQINHSAAKANQCTIRQGDWSVQGLAVNNSLHISETGNKLAAKSGTFGLIWYYDGKLDQAICSLRSIGDYDVSAIAKRFGGGGHRNAAGFKVPMEILMGWLRNE